MSQTKGVTMLDTQSYKEYVRLYNDKKETEKKLKNIKKDLLEKESFLIENLADNDMQRISISGKTLYTKINTFAVISNKLEAISILKQEGYGDFIKENYSTQAISKLIRDLLEDDGELPEGFKDIITKGTSSKLGVTSS